MCAILRPLQRDPRPAESPPLLCRRFGFLGCFQLRQYFIPLDKLLGEKQGLDVTLKERDIETAGKKARSEHLGSPTAPLQSQFLGRGRGLGHQAVESLHGLKQSFGSAPHRSKTATQVSPCQKAHWPLNPEAGDCGLPTISDGVRQPRDKWAVQLCQAQGSKDTILL